MAALCNRAGHYIFVLWFLVLLPLLFSSPIISHRKLDVYYTSHMMWPKIRHLGTITQLCRAVSSEPRHVSTIWKTCLTTISLPHVLTLWWTSAH